MREKRKSLKLKKFNIANLTTKRIIGGTDNPNEKSVVNTCQQEATHADTCYCDQQSWPNECTIGAGRTELKNGCTDGYYNTTQSGNPTEQNCP